MKWHVTVANSSPVLHPLALVLFASPRSNACEFQSVSYTAPQPESTHDPLEAS